MYRFISVYRGIAGRINGNTVFVLVAIALGVLTNVVYSFLLWGVSHFAQLPITTLLPWGAITYLIILVSTGGLFYFWFDSRRSADKYNETQKILELDERIYEHLVVAHNSPQKNDVERLLVDLLQHIVDEMFSGKVMRSFILLPDSKNAYLVPWVHYKMSRASLNEIRFYIGNEPHHQHGVAGTAFVKQSIEIAHMTLEKCHLKGDHDQFVTFDEHKTPRYRSFICVPILSAVTKNTTTCIGVACFDSSDRELFDGQETQQILKSLVKRVAEIICICSHATSLPSDDFPPAA